MTDEQKQAIVNAAIEYVQEMRAWDDAALLKKTRYYALAKFEEILEADAVEAASHARAMTAELALFKAVDAGEKP